MPKRMRRSFKRKGPKTLKKRWSGSRTDRAQSSAIVTLSKKVRKLTTAEIRAFDTQATAAVVDVTPLLVNLTYLPQGDGDGFREGSAVGARVLEIRAVFHSGANEALYNPSVRVIIFKWKDNLNGSSALASNVLTDDGSVAGNQINSAYNWFQRGSYKILSDTRHLLTQQQGSGIITNSRSLMYKKYIRLGHKITYVAPTTSIEGAGQVYMLVLSDSPGTGGTTMKVDYWARLYYTP